MKEFVTGLLMPILTDMGVSEADVVNYVGQCIGYIYALLIALAAVIAVIVVTTLKARKGIKLPINVSACVAWLLAVLIIVNMVCFGPLQSNIAMFMNNTSVLTEESANNSRAVIEELGDEGMVLVENNGLLPLPADVTNLNVFGWGSTNPIYGGTGSGSAATAGNISILQSLSNAGYSTNESLTQMYTDYAAERPAASSLSAVGGSDWTLPEPTADYYTDALLSNAADFSDTAVIVLGRTGGEGADLPTDMYTLITDRDAFDISDEMIGADGKGNSSYHYTASSYQNNGSYNDFDEGEHYLEPSNTEEAMIDIVCQNFDKVILVVNTNNPMELGWVADHPQIGAVILAPGTGATGFNALGKILNGTVNPSGKTVDTYVRDLTATPTFNNFARNFTYNNVDDLRLALAKADPAYEGNMAFANYVEGIYVGYKFYETAAEEGFLNYDEHVLYPFGYGLSYTTFSQEIANFNDEGDNVTFDVIVTNTGSVAGKDVVEVYYTPPYTNGGIEKASVNLVEFGKTSTLEAGASETISFSIPKEDFSSYDDQGIKVKGGGYILEAGTYEISIRSDSHTVLDSETFEVASDVTGRSSDLTPAVNQFDYARGKATYLSRTDGFANYDEATAPPSDELFVMDADTRAVVESYSVVGTIDFDDPNDQMPITGASNNVQLYELRGVDYDDAKWDQLLDQMSVDEMIQLINTGGWQTAEIASVGKVSTSDCDGPAGVNNFVAQKYGTGYPAAVLIAQTWSKDLLTKTGDALGREFSDLNNFGMYGPCLNGHRSAFGGRNYENYSEDCVLSGKLASAEVNALADRGVYCYMKHFAVNDQETNRCAFLLTFAPEQAIRESYLKTFELAVKNAGTASFRPLGIMSAYNFVGIKPACSNYELLTTVLRDEWGFKGVVISDYDGSHGYMITENNVRAGNDLKLGFGANASDQITHTDSATMVQALRQSSKNILYTVANSGYYAEGDPYGGMDNMTKTFITIDIAVVVILMAIEASVIFLSIKKRKSAK